MTENTCPDAATVPPPERPAGPPGDCALKVEGGFLPPGLKFWRHRQGRVAGPLTCGAVRLVPGWVTDTAGDGWSRDECHLDATSAYRACANWWQRVASERAVALEMARTQARHYEALLMQQKAV